MSSTVDQIKDRLSIEEVVAQYVSLQKAGSSLKGKCPFHNERTPSFVVSPARGSYHCFGCSVHGDMFTFVEEMEGVDFKGALKILADKAGVALVYEKEHKEIRDEQDRLREILEAATKFFEVMLKKHKHAQSYLSERGITEKTRNAFRIGFAPDQWHALEEHLTQKGFALKDIEATGCSSKGEKGYYDRFRSRIMFPIFDSAGRVVAFSGRIFGPHDDATPKYINSPETVLYDKSRILYGFDRAKQTIRKHDFAILVEGQMDLVSSHQAGYTNTVAISGTALTPDHVKLISRLSENIVIALDADDAGVAAAGKSALAALALGFDVKVARLPAGNDPSDILQHEGIPAWREYIKNAGHIIEFLLDEMAERYTDERSYRKKVEKEVLPYVLAIKSSIDREHFIQIIAERIGLTDTAVREALGHTKAPEQSTETTKQVHAGIGVLPATSDTIVSTPVEQLVNILFWQRTVTKPIISTEAIEKAIITAIGKNAFTSFEDLPQQQKDKRIFLAEKLYDDEVSLQKAVTELLDRLKLHGLNEKLLHATNELLAAEKKGVEKDITKWVKECDALHRELAAFAVAQSNEHVA